MNRKDVSKVETFLKSHRPEEGGIDQNQYDNYCSFFISVLKQVLYADMYEEHKTRKARPKHKLRLIS